MGDISVWGAGKAGRVMFNLESPLTTVYVALINGAEPTAFLTGSELAEPGTVDGYARQSLALNSTNFYESDYGRIVCQVDVTFPTATGDWGRLKYWALTTASTGGNVVFYGRFKRGKRIETGDVARIPGGSMQIRAVPGP